MSAKACGQSTGLLFDVNIYYKINIENLEVLMKFHEILTESQPEKIWLTDSEEEVVSFLKTNCKPWLIQSKGKLAYRGTIKSLPRFTIAYVNQVRSNRKPMNTPEYITKMYDEVFREAGATALRSNSVFLSGNKSQAIPYGDVYCAFPIGNFNYTWVPEIRDLFVDITNDDRISWIPRFQFGMSPEEFRNIPSIRTRLHEFIIRSKRLNNRQINILIDKLQQASIDETVEAFATHPETRDMLVRMVTDEIKKIIKDFKIRSDDGSLHTALGSGKEIIVKCDKILMIAYDHWPTIRKLL